MSSAATSLLWRTGSLLAVVARCPRALGRRQTLPRAAGWPLEGPDLALCFFLLEQQLLFWGCLIIPAQMSAACWGRAGRPAWAAEEKLGHGIPVGNETRDLLWRCTRCKDGDKAASTGEQSQQPCHSCPLHAAFHLLCQELGTARGVLGQQQRLVPARMLLPHKRGASPCSAACWWLAGGLCSRPSSWHLSETLHSFFSTMPKQILADY